MINVTTKTWSEEVTVSDLPVLVDFWAPWCGPCKMIAPFLEIIDKDRDDLKIVKVNVDDEEELATTFSIRSIPTVALFINGNEIDRVLGVNKDAIIKMINGFDLKAHKQSEKYGQSMMTKYKESTKGD